MEKRALNAWGCTLIIIILFFPFGMVNGGNSPASLRFVNTFNSLVYKKSLSADSYPLFPGYCDESLNHLFTSAIGRESISESGAQHSEKSKGKAFMLSMLLPGAGEYYVGRKTRAKSFFISELVLWATYAGFKIYGGWSENEYKVFAGSHAGANTENKKHRYFVDMGNFDNICEYNDFQLRQRELDDVYPETDQYFWQWDSHGNREKFERIRIRSDNANQRALFMTGAIFINHLVSAIDAVWVTFKHNKQAKQSKNHFNFQYSNIFQKAEFRFTFSRSF